MSFGSNIHSQRVFQTSLRHGDTSLASQPSVLYNSSVNFYWVITVQVYSLMKNEDPWHRPGILAALGNSMRHVYQPQYPLSMLLCERQLLAGKRGGALFLIPRDV